MEVFMRNVPWNATRTNVILLLVEHLHTPDFLLGEAPFNFNVQLPRGKNGEENSGIGFLTFPTAEIGSRFLDTYQHGLELFDRIIQFNPSRNPAGRSRVVEETRRTPFIHPQVLEDEQERIQQLSNNSIVISTVQFGWDCRDRVFSIESEAHFTGTLSFDDERRQFRMEFVHIAHKYHIAIPVAQIDFLVAHSAHDGRTTILFKLYNPPLFEVDLEDIPSRELRKSDGDDSQSTRKRISSLPLPHDHERVVPYTSLAVRLISPFADALDNFQKLCELSGYRHVSTKSYPAERRNLCSSAALDEFATFTRELPWPVTFENVLKQKSATQRRHSPAPPLTTTQPGQAGSSNTDSAVVFILVHLPWKGVGYMLESEPTGSECTFEPR